jgi:hypothetical protein
MDAWTSRSLAISPALRRSHPVPAFANVVACANDMVFAEIRLATGEIVRAELHWYEATGIGKREMKIKAFL